MRSALQRTGAWHSSLGVAPLIESQSGTFTIPSRRVARCARTQATRSRRTRAVFQAKLGKIANAKPVAAERLMSSAEHSAYLTLDFASFVAPRLAWNLFCIETPSGLVAKSLSTDHPQPANSRTAGAVSRKSHQPFMIHRVRVVLSRRIGVPRGKDAASVNCIASALAPNIVCISKAASFSIPAALVSSSSAQACASATTCGSINPSAKCL